MQRVDVAWLVGWAVAGVGFYAADRLGVALCSSTRRVFRTHTWPGRVAFTAAYGTGALVLHRHVLKDT